MKKILITGGTGFVGGRLAKRLSAENEVYVSSRKKLQAADLNIYGDVQALDHQSLLSIGDFPTVDTIIHLAALNEWDSVKYPSEAIRVNIDETRIILENSIAKNASQFIYFSTAHVYGSPLTGNISELSLAKPAHPYAITHRAAEDYVTAAVRNHRIEGIVLRLSNSFGAPVSPDVNRWTLLANDLCRQAVEKGFMTLTSNGCQYRDFICLADVEEIVNSLIERTVPLKHVVYNLGSGLATRVINIARIIEQLCVTVLRKNVRIEMPAHAIETTEPGLELSVNRLLEEGYQINNDVLLELERLLQFCAEHFAR